MAYHEETIDIYVIAPNTEEALRIATVERTPYAIQDWIEFIDTYGVVLNGTPYYETTESRIHWDTSEGKSPFLLIRLTES